ncbi:MAG: hypothetical protein IPM47_05515 [Sphingobacteriales bacterium]|nr:MAG: hypothetical protein IPM47_05515 [Sphingobacteriales bacterium]
MKHITTSLLCFLALLLLFAQYILAQKPAILHLEEYDQRGKTHPIGKKNATIDVNSIVNVSVNKDSLRLRVGRFLEDKDGGVKKLLDEVSLIGNILADYSQQLDALDKVLEEYANQPREKKDPSILRKAEAGIADRVLAAIALIKTKPQLYEQLDEALGKLDRNASSTDEYLEVFTITQIALDNAQQLLEEVINQQGVKIQMGAWIVTDNGTSPVRLEGFGDVAQGERFEVSRNQLSLNEKQIAELRSYQQVFAGNAQKLSEMTKKSQRPLSMLLEKITAKVDSFEVQVKTLIDNAKNAGKSVSEQAQGEVLKYVEDYQTFLESLNQKYLLGTEYTDAVELLIGIEADTRRLKEKTEAFIRIDKFLLELKTNLAGNPELEKSLQDIMQVVAIIGETRQQITTFVNNFKLLLKGRQVNSEALEFTDEIYKLTFNELPLTTQFNLLFTGARKPGDLIVLKIAALPAESKRSIELETHNLRLANALPHIDIAVAYAFALPTKGNPDKSWLGGPSYSMLFKFGSRNMLYRNFIDAGLGINFAAFDFNKDGNPEISAGATGSLFKDYVQGGVGFNFSSNSPYYHVGLRIPIPSTSIGLFKNSKGQENPDADFGTEQ